MYFLFIYLYTFLERTAINAWLLLVTRYFYIVVFVFVLQDQSAFSTTVSFQNWRFNCLDESNMLLICCTCHCLCAHLSCFLYFSHFLYPSKSWKGGDSGGEDASSSGDGKYELLSVANNLIAEEIRNVMSNSKLKSVFVSAKLTYNRINGSFSLTHW